MLNTVKYGVIFQNYYVITIFITNFTPSNLIYDTKVMESIEKSNTSENKKVKMTLRDYFRNLPEANTIAPRKNLIQRISDRCNVPISTARSWLLYGNKPRDNREQVIAVLSEETGIAPEDMWAD